MTDADVDDDPKRIRLCVDAHDVVHARWSHHREETLNGKLVTLCASFAHVVIAERYGGEFVTCLFCMSTLDHLGLAP